VVGAGKAAASMAAAVDALWPADAPLQGLVVTRYGHVPPGLPQPQARIAVLEAAHPVPDTAGQQAAKRIAAQVAGLGPDDLVLALISGGGSALLALPGHGITLADKQALNQALLASGASIDEMNCVRKHLSALKGGRLAALAAPARVVSLLISDVPGDDPAVIASGPTVPDPSTCQNALAICQRYQLPLPAAAHAGLASGAFETPKPGDARFQGHAVHLIATPQQSLEAAAALARAQGVAAHILSDAIKGESRDVGKVHAALARQVARQGQPFTRPCVLLSGGETTVTLRGPGKGGRNQEMALAFLDGLARGARDAEQAVFLAASTDGGDGPTDAAGAFASLDILRHGLALGLDPARFLAGNDAYHYFSAVGALLVTGPTNTNVCDIKVLLSP